jgi:hypothetical protein
VNVIWGGASTGWIFGPGYGDKLVILLVGGTKTRQQRDVEAAQAR